MSESLTEPAKLLLLAALLTNDKIISNNGKSFLKELILRRDSRLGVLLKAFEEQNSGDSAFLETLHDLIMDEANQLYNELFFDTSLEVGKTLSKNERDEKLLAAEKSLIYGEVEFNSFYRVLRKINPAPGTVFYDLGSGTGKAVFAARFAYDFSKCIGIEILSSLHEQGEKVLLRYNKDFKNNLALGQSQHAMLYEGSFLDFDWFDGELVFANSTCYDDQLMLALSDMAGRLQPGAIVVTFTKGMSSDKVCYILTRYLCCYLH
jgi:SAM-dependent methyltransferase